MSRYDAVPPPLPRRPCVLYDRVAIDLKIESNRIELDAENERTNERMYYDPSEIEQYGILLQNYFFGSVFFLRNAGTQMKTVGACRS